MALISTIPPLTDAVDPLDKDLVQGDGTSVYRLKHAEKPPGRLSWEFWASHLLLMVKMDGFSLYDWREWCATPIKDGSRKLNSAKLHELRTKWPDLAQPIDEAVDALEDL